ncbi:MAG: redoxin domain-containing protein [Planctomycetota bacterium]
MKQLVQLKEYESEFKALNAELLFVFREESEGVEGLKKIKQKYDPPYLLSIDLNKKQTAAYSAKRRTFDNFVIDKEGVVRAVIDGTLRDRAKADELIKVLKSIESQ